MDEPTNTAATTRAKPPKMRAFICKPVCVNCGDGPQTIEVLAEAKSVSDKDVKAAIKPLGYGKYTVLTCRFDEREYKEVKRDSIV